MADNLTIFGTTYNNVTGIKATDTNGVVQTFVKGGSPSPSYSSVSSGANFIDYDGTVLHAYTTADALALSALPANPSHTGLTAQGWNWSLANIQSYLTSHPDGVVNVGQMYITDSAATEIDIVLDDLNYLSPYLMISVNGTVEVDWGDNSSVETVTGSSLTTNVFRQHTYPTVGSYTIKISQVSGSYTFYNSTANVASPLTVIAATSNRTWSQIYSHCIKHVRLGSGITTIGNNAFSKCSRMQTITIPNSVTTMGVSAFAFCYSLICCTIPKSTSSLGNSLFNYDAGIVDILLSESAVSFGTNTFYGCSNLCTVTIPEGVTSISSYMFAGCSTLESIIIPNSVTTIGTYAFNGCTILNYISLPNRLTTINDHAFISLFALVSITIPNTVTQIKTYAFQSCYTLDKIVIPASVTTIGTYVFQYCYGAHEYHFKRETPPSISSSTFSGIESGTVIYVPYSEDHSILNAYKAATNWSSYASYIQEEPQ